MNIFQIFSLLIIAALLVYAVVWFLNRFNNKACPECQRSMRQEVDWTHTTLDEENVERESDSESDLSSDEDEKENVHDTLAAVK
jgi:hypothetical protein